MTDDLARARRKLREATARLDVLESTLIDVWRWTNDGHPHLELLIPILKAADAEYAVIAALDEVDAP